MSLDTIAVGDAANDGNGDPLRTGFQKTNAAITALNAGMVVGVGSTEFKDDDASTGVNVDSNGNVSVTESFGANGGFTIQGKFAYVKSAGSGNDSLAVIHAARDAVGEGGVIMLTGGQDYEISDDIRLETAGQVLHVVAGASITAQDTTNGASVRVLGDDCMICGAGVLNYTTAYIGSYSTVGQGEGFKLIGHGLTFKNPIQSAIIVVDVFGDKPIEITGARAYWAAAGVAVTKNNLPLIINVETYDAASNMSNVLIRDCEVDFTAWSEQDVAEVLYPSASGSPNLIGIRVSAANESTITNLRIESNRVLMPTATQGQASWNPGTYVSPGDGVGGRRPTGYEVTADRSDLNYTAKSGSFTAGETITGDNSGATCIVGSDSTNSMKQYSRTGVFEPGETIRGGTSTETATYTSIQGGVREFTFRNNKVIGGDLGVSFGNIDTVLYSGNRSDDQTSYPLECATSHIITGSGNHFGGRLAGKALSLTNTVLANLSGSYVECGANTDFGDSNTGLGVEGAGHVNMTGSTFKAGADNISLVKIRTAGSPLLINFTGCSFLGEEFTGIKAIHFDQGTVEGAIVSDCLFRDIDTNSIVVDSGVTVTRLITSSVIGVNAAAFSNAGTITTHVNNNNIGITGLDGAIDTDLLNVDSANGVVGINEASPSDKTKLHLSATGNHMFLEETDAATDEKVWVFNVGGGFFQLQTRNDAYGYLSAPLTISRAGQFQLSDGSASVPTLSFLSDTDSGIYSPGADQLGFAVGGVDAFAVDSSKDVTFLGDLTLYGSTPILNFRPTADAQGIRMANVLNAATGAFQGNFTYDIPSGEWRWTSNANGSIVKMKITADGACNTVDGFNVDDTPVIDGDGVHILPSYTVATVPSASAKGAGAQIFVTDETGGAVNAFSDSTNWRRVTDRAIIS